MANARVRDQDHAVYERLKARTAASFQVDLATALAEAEAMRRRLAGRPHSDSGMILSEDRQR